MRAVVYEDIGVVRVDDVPEPKIEDPKDAIVELSASAICGSDLHFFHGKAPILPGEPLGHEGVGVVETVGEGVERFKPGDRVVPAFNIVCGECWFCRHGQTSLCEDFRNLGAGEMAGSPGGTQAEGEKARFIIRAPYSRWKEVIKKELDPVKGMMQGKLKLKGDLPTIVRYVKASNILVDLAGEVPTEFVDEQ